MSFDPTIDIPALLAPISEELPTGEPLSLSDFDGPLMKIKDAWDEARKLVKEVQEKERFGGIDSHGEPWRSIPAPDWQSVIDDGTTILVNKTKDLRVASWLSEALLRDHHISGLRDGLTLCKGLCDQYWDTLHPEPNEEDGHGVALSAFAALMSDMTFNAVFETPLVKGQKSNEREERSYSAQDYLNAKELETADPTERERRIEEGEIEMVDFTAIQDLTPPEFHSQNLETIDQCISILGELDEFFRSNCKDDEYGEPTSPGVSSFREQLDSLRRIVTELAGDAAETEDVDDESESEDGGSGGTPQKKAMTRESAFKTIETVAQFFEKTEPHTPVHFALRQVVRWGRMPLHELLAELIDDGSVMGSLRRQIGLPPEEQE